MSDIDARISSVTWNQDGLAPVIVQQFDTKAVLTLAWVNAEALRLTLTTGRATYWSRSRQELWRKGDTSGNIQEVKGAFLDCDSDALLLLVDQTGSACHRGNDSCFDSTDLEPVVI